MDADSLERDEIPVCGQDLVAGCRYGIKLSGASLEPESLLVFPTTFSIQGISMPYSPSFSDEVYRVSEFRMMHEMCISADEDDVRAVLPRLHYRRIYRHKQPYERRWDSADDATMSPTSLI
nr:hypothetical protein CFP56_52224 [Quercus suber]